jgi:hypothetical protein
MHKFVLAFVAMASLTVLSAQSPPPPPTPAKTGQEQQQYRAGKENNSAASQPNAESSQATKENETYENQSSQYGHKTTTNWIVAFTAVLAGAAVLQVVIYIFQACYMNKGLKLTRRSAIAARKSGNASAKAAKTAEDSLIFAKENAHLDQRAWVSPNGTATTLISQGLSKSYTAAVLLKNTGKTPAIKCFIRSNCSLKFVPDADPDFDKLLQDAYMTEFGVIAPNQVTKHTVNTELIPVHTLSNPLVIVLMFGKVVYQDVFKSDHWASFCYRLRESTTGIPRVEYEVYGSYNRTDD